MIMKLNEKLILLIHFIVHWWFSFSINWFAFHPYINCKYQFTTVTWKASQSQFWTKFIAPCISKIVQDSFWLLINCVVPQNIHTPHGRFFGLTGYPPLPWKFQFSLHTYIHILLTHPWWASYFPLKILAFETPLPLGISNDLPWGGYGYFMEPHIYKICKCAVRLENRF